MKNHKLIRPMLALASSAFLANAFVPSASAGLADPVGIVAVTVPGTNTVLTATPFARPVEAFGTITSWDNTGANAVFTVAITNAPGKIVSTLNNTDQNQDLFYQLEIVDGPSIGLIMDIIGGTVGSSLEVSGQLPASVVIPSGTKFNVRKSWTISTLFGPASTNNVFGFGNTPSATTVNAQVQAYDVATGGLKTFTISSLGGYNWRQSGFTNNRNHFPIGLGTGYIIANRKTSNFVYNLSGDFRAARTRLVCPANKSILLGNPGAFDVKFTDSTITDASPTRATSVPAASGPNAGDEYRIWNVATRAFKSLRIGGTTVTNVTATVPSGASAYDGGTRTNPVLAKFTALLVKPVGTNAQVVTVAPALVQTNQ